MPPTVFAEDLSPAAAEKLLANQDANVGQRNEALNTLRANDPARLMVILDRIVFDPTETDLFKSWALQHVGVMAPSLSPELAEIWTMRLENIVSNTPISSPIWREGLYALAAFPQPLTRMWVRDYIRRLTWQQKLANFSILAEIMAGPKRDNPEQDAF